MKRFLFQSLRLLALSALGGAAWVAHRAETLPPVAAPAEKGKENDVLGDLRQAAIKRTTIIEIKEAELNRYLAATLSTRIGGEMGQGFRLNGVRVDLEPGQARVVLVWEFYGHPRTASIDLVVRRVDDHFHVEMLGGAFGHLRLPRGMMRPLYPTLDTVTSALDQEIKALFQMTQITLAKDKLVLDSRFPTA
ncbi:MAG: hypothetical protein JNG86_02055 [Verrucomicrobiaceae bacterium]|nr:hypothetical protein [Verrucomicrobiaceae bacterium]